MLSARAVQVQCTWEVEGSCDGASPRSKQPELLLRALLVLVVRNKVLLTTSWYWSCLLPVPTAALPAQDPALLPLILGRPGLSKSPMYRKLRPVHTPSTLCQTGLAEPYSSHQGVPCKLKRNHQQAQLLMLVSHHPSYAATHLNVHSTAWL